MYVKIYKKIYMKSVLAEKQVIICLRPCDTLILCLFMYYFILMVKLVTFYLCKNKVRY